MPTSPDYIQDLNARGRRVTARRSRLGGQQMEAPLGHVTERWRRLVFEGRKGINASMYEVAAFEALNNGLRSGDLHTIGSRGYQTFESYLLSKEHWIQLKQTGQTRLALGGTAAEYLEGRRQHLAELLAKLARDVDSVESITVDKKGELHLTASEQLAGLVLQPHAGLVFGGLTSRTFDTYGDSVYLNRLAEPIAVPAIAIGDVEAGQKELHFVAVLVGDTRVRMTFVQAPTELNPSPGDIMDWLEQTARGWNADPTPFIWAGRSHLRRHRAYLRRHPLGGSGACTTRPIRRRPVALTYHRAPGQVAH